MKKILLVIGFFVALNTEAQVVNKFRDSSVFFKGVRFDSTLVFKGLKAGSTADTNVVVISSTGKASKVSKSAFLGDLPIYSISDSNTVINYDVLNSQNTPPVSPSTGDVYLIGTVPTGAWVGHAKDIAEWNGSAWVFTDGVQGDFLYNATNALTYIFRSGNWVQTTGIPALHNGNTISSGLKIGTRNNKDFNFISNNILRGGMLANGSFRVANQGGSGNVLVGADSLGVQRKLYIGDGLSLSNDSLLASGGGGGSPAGSSNQIQINQSGAFFADSTFQKSDADFNVGLNHTQQSPITFTGSGLDDLTLSGTFSGTYPTTYTVTIDGINKDFVNFPTSSISGSGFQIGETVTSTSGGSATIDAVNQNSTGSYENLVLSGITGTFLQFDTITGSTSGTTATLDGDLSQQDTYTWTDGTTTVSNVICKTFGSTLISNNVLLNFDTGTSHTLSDSWTWTYSTVNQNVLDFSNNDYNFKSTFGTDTFGYQISDNLLGAGISGSVNTWTTTGGDLGVSGFYTGEDGFGNNTFIQWADGYVSGNTISKGSIGFFTSNGSDQFEYQTTINSFILINTISNIDYGISQSAGVVSIGQITGPGNSTKITIDDVNEHITISNLPAYDDDTAAGVGGLTAGMVYMTTGSGSAPLNAAGILMIKQ